jgi:hypothetical protein
MRRATDYAAPRHPVFRCSNRAADDQNTPIPFDIHSIFGVKSAFNLKIFRSPNERLAILRRIVQNE